MTDAAVDKLSNDVNELSISISNDDEARAHLERWFTTHSGARFMKRYNFEFEDLNDLKRAGDLHDAIVKSSFELTLVMLRRSDPVRNVAELPSDIADYIFGAENERTLCDLKRAMELLLEGDPVKFALGCYVDPINPPKGVVAAHREEQSVILSRAFSAPFQGDALSWLESGFAVYEDVYEAEKYYGKTVPIVQSSGMGKSRLMAELAQHEYLVSVCFRNMRGEVESSIEPNPQMGWPPRDKPACNFFTAASSGEFHGEELAAAFLGALFAKAGGLLESSPSPSVFAKHWDISDPTRILESARHSLFEEITDAANQSLTKNEKALHRARSDHLPVLKTSPLSLPTMPAPSATESNGPAPMTPSSSNGVSRPSSKSPQSDVKSAAKPKTATLEPVRGTAAWCKKLFGLFIESPAKRLTEQLISRNPDHTTFFIVFDECSELDIARHTPGSIRPPFGMSLLALQRVLKSCEDLSVWTFLLDTNSGLNYCMPTTGELGSSARLIGDLVPLPPFHYLEYNIMARSALTPATMSDALHISQIKNYGRPLWKSIPSDQCIAAASRKLLNNTTFQPRDDQHVLAVFSARVLIDLSLTPAATKLALDAIRCHMRVLTGVLPHNVINTCAPSEPILAVAAAYNLTRDDVTGKTSSYKTALSTLVKKLILQGCVAERGTQGELLACLILVVTRDCALPRDPAGLPIVYREDNVDVGPMIQTIDLSCFLTELLGDTLETASIRDDKLSRPASVEAIHKWALPYVLNFTHFTQLSKNITTLSSEFLWECWRGGAGIVCGFQQPKFDILLVGYRGELNKPFNPYHIGLVPVQVKLRGCSASGGLASDLACPDIICDGQRWTPPHLAIVMDLGTDSNFAETSKSDSQGRTCQIGRDCVEQPMPTDTWSGVPDTTTESSRFVINVRGHASYNVMRSGHVAEDLALVFDHINNPPVLRGMEGVRDSMIESLDIYSRHLPQVDNKAKK